MQFPFGDLWSEGRVNTQRSLGVVTGDVRGVVVKVFWRSSRLILIAPRPSICVIRAAAPSGCISPERDQQALFCRADPSNCRHGFWLQERDLVYDADSYENLVGSMRQTLAHAEESPQDLQQPEVEPVGQPNQTNQCVGRRDEA
jgi:hypothetical protein